MPISKVILIHVPYQNRGGEDIHVESMEYYYSKLGIKAVRYPIHSERKNNFLNSLKSLFFSSNFAALDALITKEKPDYLHIHNIFPELGPRFLFWAKKNKVKLVATVHNHRFFCTNGLALRRGKNCSDCFKAPIAWRSLLRNCNGSWIKTIYHSIALSEIRLGHLWIDAVEKFIAPSPYIRDQLIQFGVPQQKIDYILHPIEKPEHSQQKTEKNFDILYAGRLSAEKGVPLIIEAAKKLPQYSFAIAGGGPLEQELKNMAAPLSNILFLGQKTKEEVGVLIEKSRIGVLPSLCNEILSLSALEMFIRGKICVLTETESSKWFLKMNFPVLLAKVGDADDFVSKIKVALEMNPVSSEKISQIQKQFGEERFLMEMRTMLSSL